MFNSPPELVASRISNYFLTPVYVSSISYFRQMEYQPSKI